jgi:competence ComEA-like helix-hairpin-helix protein
MILYTRHQLLVLLVLLGAAGLGLALGQWRRAHPDLVERLEQFDRSPTPVAPAAPPPPRREQHETQRPATPGTARARKSNDLAIDLNRADVAELTRLPGVGPALAARIVDARDTTGPFATVDDLRRVKGLGRTKIERLRPLVRLAE